MERISVIFKNLIDIIVQFLVLSSALDQHLVHTLVSWQQQNLYYARLLIKYHDVQQFYRRDMYTCAVQLNPNVLMVVTKCMALCRIGHGVLILLNTCFSDQN